MKRVHRRVRGEADTFFELLRVFRGREERRNRPARIKREASNTFHMSPPEEGKKKNQTGQICQTKEALSNEFVIIHTSDPPHTWVLGGSLERNMRKKGGIRGMRGQQNELALEKESRGGVQNLLKLYRGGGS